jgi:hypothetical protein
MIAAERAIFPLKVNRFQSDRVEVRILGRARPACPATEAVSVAIAEKREFLGPECEQALASIEAHLRRPSRSARLWSFEPGWQAQGLP